MGTIHLLDEQTVNYIAAGEVIERPASVVKELVENALDAGARSVHVRVEEGGKALVAVRDDGCGMDRGDALLAFRKHATSKIRRAEDLQDVATAGFRGEALPSIAAVARVRLTTCEAGGGTGTRLTVEGGEVQAVADVATPAGTTFEVAELFHNTPARAKHLRRTATELRHIVRAMTVLALARPEVAFTLVHGDRTLLEAPATDLRGRLGTLLGREVARGTVDIDYDAPGLALTGLLALPAESYHSPARLYLHVNRRPVQARSLAYAIRRAYGNLLHDGRFPIGVLDLTLPAGEVDVNVHPAKLTVRFVAEQALADKLTEVVARTLKDEALVPHLALGEPRAEMSSPTRTPGATRDAEPTTGEGVQAQLAVSVDERPLPPTTLPEMRPVALLARRYIVATGPEGLYLVDFHAAHERVMYERLRLQTRYARMGSQDLLEPLPLELSRPEALALKGLQQELAEVGFAVERFGASSFVVRAVPVLLAGAGSGVVREAVAELIEHGALRSAVERQERMLYTIACHAALRAGIELTAAQMEFVLREMASIPNPYACVHGRPTVMTITPAELDRKFKRTGFN